VMIDVLLVPKKKQSAVATQQNILAIPCIEARSFAPRRPFLRHDRVNASALASR
jgi:hypothetical protein